MGRRERFVAWVSPVDWRLVEVVRGGWDAWQVFGDELFDVGDIFGRGRAVGRGFSWLRHGSELGVALAFLPIAVGDGLHTLGVVAPSDAACVLVHVGSHWRWLVFGFTAEVTDFGDCGAFCVGASPFSTGRGDVGVIELPEVVEPVLDLGLSDGGMVSGGPEVIEQAGNQGSTLSLRLHGLDVPRRLRL